MATTDLEIRKMNLIDLLLEDHDDVEEPPEYACQLWTEDQIRQYFENGGLVDGFPTPGTVEPAKANGLPAPPKVVDAAQLMEKYPPVSQAEFEKWFPGLTRSKTQVASPKFRLICFTNAGNEENVFTVEGIGARRVSTLLEWCRGNQVEMLAVQLPGRGKRRDEGFFETTKQVAGALLKVLGSQLISTPYCVIGHSVGTWCSFEFLTLARQEGFPMPQHVFFSAFPSPDIPDAQRPWKRSRNMADPEFMEEARMWDVNEVVFSPQMWTMYSPLMRADFRLFDEYDFSQEGMPPFEFPITTFFATKDKKVKKDMILGWQKFTSSNFDCHEICGDHLYLMGVSEENKAAKIRWYELIVERLAAFK